MSRISKLQDFLPVVIPAPLVNGFNYIKLFKSLLLCLKLSVSAYGNMDNIT